MIPYQLQLEEVLGSFERVATLMMMRWSWPIAESAHFIGLTLLLGSIAAWDLRLLGVLRGGSITAFHRLVPFAVIGFGVNLASGLVFLMTYPDQYVYNAAFHLKMLCVLLAGLNVVVFYLGTFRRMDIDGAEVPPSSLARLHGGVSLALWVTVIVCGRMITFYRPGLCAPGATMALLADCLPR